MKEPHTPVLLKEVLQYFEGTIKTFFEGTVGAGGHASHILHQHPEIDLYLATDQDPHALEIAHKTLKPGRSLSTEGRQNRSLMQDVHHRLTQQLSLQKF